MMINVVMQKINDLKNFYFRSMIDPKTAQIPASGTVIYVTPEISENIEVIMSFF